jgi:hypothetical protein
LESRCFIANAIFSFSQIEPHETCAEFEGPGVSLGLQPNTFVFLELHSQEWSWSLLGRTSFPRQSASAYAEFLEAAPGLILDVGRHGQQLSFSSHP